MDEKERDTWWLEQAKRIAPIFFKIPSGNLEPLAYTHNRVFALSHEGSKYILRLRTDSPMSANHLRARSEAKFLRQLREDTSLIAPLPVLTRNGDYYLIIPNWSRQLHRGAVIAGTMFEYVEGHEISATEITQENVHKIGVFLAELHNYTKPYKHEGVDKGRYCLNRFSWGGTEVFPDNYRFYETSKALFSPEQLNVMNTIALVVKSAMDELGQSEDEFGLIHGDLLLKNILFHEGEVRALDFEYCGWGYYLYDLCPLLWQLKPLPNYKELEEALWNGYCSIRPLTERHRQLLETFIAARQVASMRWVAANQHNPAYQGKVASILQQRTAELQGFLETGILTRS